MQPWQEPFKTPIDDELDSSDKSNLILKWFFFVTIITMSFVDAILTYVGVTWGVMVELNPLMLFLLNWPIAFFVIKMIMTIASVGMICRVNLPNKSFSIYALILVFVIYFIVLAIHINGWMSIQGSEFSIQEIL